MANEYGIKLGNFFLGVTANKTIYEPFDRSSDGDPSDKPSLITGTNFEDLMSAVNGHYSTKNLIELFSTVPEIFAPIDAWASRVALGEYSFERIKTGEKITDNVYLNKILNSPNPMQTLRDLIYEYVCYCKVTGDNYLYSPTPESLSRVDYKNIINTYNLPSDQTEPILPQRIKLFSAKEKSDLVLGYVVMKGQADEFVAKTANVLYQNQVNLKWKDRKMKGRSPLLSAKKAIMNLIAVYEARNVIYVKRGALGAIISKRQDGGGSVAVTPKEKKKILDDINKVQGVTAGKNPYAVVTHPIDFVRFSMSIQELMPFEETLADTAAIYATLGVPRELMPKNSDSTYANQRDAEKNFIQTRIQPFGEALCKALSVFWNLEEAGIRMVVDYSHLPSLKANQKEEAETDKIDSEVNKTLFLNGIITLNQWKTDMGYQVSDNKLYDKLIYNMDQTDLDLVKQVMELQMRLNPTHDQQLEKIQQQNNTP